LKLALSTIKQALAL